VIGWSSNYWDITPCSRWKSTSASVGHTTSNLNNEEQAEKEFSKKKALRRGLFLPYVFVLGLSCYLEGGSSMIHRKFGGFLQDCKALHPKR
jgi:hypothetical protein